MQRVIAIVSEPAALAFLVNDLAQSAGGILVEVAHLRTVPLLLLPQSALDIRGPLCAAAYCVGKALDGTAPAPLKSRHAAQWIGTLAHLAERAVFEQRLASSAVANHRGLQSVIRNLVKRAVWISNA